MEMDCSLYTATDIIKKLKSCSAPSPFDRMSALRSVQLSFLLDPFSNKADHQVVSSHQHGTNTMHWEDLLHSVEESLVAVHANYPLFKRLLALSTISSFLQCYLRLSPNKALAICWLDLANAYGSSLILCHYQAPPQFLSILHSLYSYHCQHFGFLRKGSVLRSDIIQVMLIPN